MIKYICLCGMTFNKKNKADLHYEVFKHEEHQHGFPSHQIIKQNFKGYLLEWLFSIDIAYILEVGAGSIINALIITHSSWSTGEKFLESLCAGIILTRIFKK